MKLYIRQHPDEIPQPWWDRFEQSLPHRYDGTEALEKHIKDRREKLDAAGAILQWDKASGLPYLKFRDEQSMLCFLLKWY
jgi:hypothetical protein